MDDELRHAGFKELVLWLLRLRRRFCVAGASMAPLLNPGDEVLVDPRAYRYEPPRSGNIVVVKHPYRVDVRLIKRVSIVLKNDYYCLAGDNPSESTDSRSFGAVSRQYIFGRVTSRFP